MSLYNYIPNHCPFHLEIGSEIFEILGIYKISMNIDEGTANYSVWIGTDKIKTIMEMPEGMGDCLILTPTELDITGAVHFSESTVVSCHISKISYHSRRHGYIVEFSFDLHPHSLGKFRYLGPKKDDNKDTTRFDLMDIGE